jgi:hypothetical protein
MWGGKKKHGKVGQATDDNVIRRMRIACWLPKTTNTHSEYVIRIPFARLQWLGKRALMLHLYVHRLTYINLCFADYQPSTR